MVIVHEGFLFFPIGLEKKAGNLVKATADTMQKAFGAAKRVIALKGIEQVFLDLPSAMELAGGNLLLDLVDLDGSQVADIALVVQDQYGIKAFAAVDSQPIAHAARGHLQQIGNFIDRHTVAEPKQREKPLLDLARNVGTKKFVDLMPFVLAQRKAHENPSSWPWVPSHRQSMAKITEKVEWL